MQCIDLRIVGQPQVPHSIVGVVGDVRRDMDGHHYAEVMIDSHVMSWGQNNSATFRFVRFLASTKRNWRQFKGFKLSFFLLLKTLFSHGLETKPKKFDLKKDRYQVKHVFLRI